MPYKDSGVLFPVREKRSEKGPDMDGRAELVCPHCKTTANWGIGAWVKMARNGGKFMSLSFREKEAQQERITENLRDKEGGFPWDS